MVDKHAALKEEVAAFALDSLEASRASAVERHLRTCRSCRADLAAYRRISDGLLFADAPKMPPMALRRKLLQQPGHAERPAASRRSWSFGTLALGAAMIVLLALNLLSLQQVSALHQAMAEQDSRNTSAQTAIAMLAYPGTQVVSFNENGVAGSLMVDRQRNLLAVFAWHLPPAPSSKVYQVWLVDPQGNRTSGGFLSPETGYPFTMTVIQSPAPLTGFTSIGVTLEPSGGSSSPTGTRIFGAGF